MHFWHGAVSRRGCQIHVPGQASVRHHVAGFWVKLRTKGNLRTRCRFWHIARQRITAACDPVAVLVPNAVPIPAGISLLHDGRVQECMALARSLLLSSGQPTQHRRLSTRSRAARELLVRATLQRFDDALDEARPEAERKDILEEVLGWVNSDPTLSELIPLDKMPTDPPEPTSAGDHTVAATDAALPTAVTPSMHGGASLVPYRAASSAQSRRCCSVLGMLPASSQTHHPGQAADAGPADGKALWEAIVHNAVIEPYGVCGLRALIQTVPKGALWNVLETLLVPAAQSTNQPAAFESIDTLIQQLGSACPSFVVDIPVAVVQALVEYKLCARSPPNACDLRVLAAAMMQVSDVPASTSLDTLRTWLRQLCRGKSESKLSQVTGRHQILGVVMEVGTLSQLMAFAKHPLIAAHIAWKRAVLTRILPVRHVQDLRRADDRKAVYEAVLVCLS